MKDILPNTNIKIEMPNVKPPKQKLYVIITNTSIVNNQYQDFQNLIFKPYQQTWEDFKKFILTENNLPNDDENKINKGTMIGNVKRKDWKITEILINDGHHLEIIVSSYHRTTNVKYYMITEEQFSNLL